ncbi:MAG TPA: RiPP maturation radical SAM C-methyltransferase [Streptosporangiaceae bacterium]|nr:RiPP maturation radical SAM C-methyltransferase [Streptosporangiaceae bacterium]
MALVNMPWARAEVPSIQCGLLKAGLERHGYRADVHYLNLELSALLGPQPYRAVMSLRADRSHLLGEWLFSTAAFGRQDDGSEYFAAVLGEDSGLEFSPVELLRLRDEVLPGWLDRVAAEDRWQQYGIVGFTSTFEQNVASLALARRLKDRYPAQVNVFGGANFDGEMGVEYVRAIDWIDYAVIGEGDRALPELVRRLAGGQDAAAVPGVCHRGAGPAVTGKQPAPQVADLDSLPAPDYDEYFAALARLGREAVLGPARPHLLYESSRGCWWGEKHHCTFCGLNGSGMKYRAKSAEAVIRDIRDLTARHHVLTIDAVDNILDMSYFRSVLPALQAQAWDLRMFYEVKANLTADQLRLLRGAGVATIQPGIESLSTHVLGLMRKGSTMLINLRLLKWAQAYGIETVWNILTGFPGETDADYERQIDLIPSLHHLNPPGGCGAIWLERFSPYFFDSAFPISDVTPSAAYRHVYPPPVRADQIAYYFDYVAGDTASPAVRARLGEAVRDWQARWAAGRRPQLRSERGPGWLRIADTRGPRYREAVLDDWRAGAYEHCGGTAHSAAAVLTRLHADGADQVTERRLLSFLRSCVAQRLMAEEDGHFLSLAIPAGTGEGTAGPTKPG